MQVYSHRDLLVWQRAMDLVVEVYAITKAFPNEELYGLTSQLRRAAVSIPANIAEGRGRSTRRDFMHYLYIAKGSLMEVDTLLLISARLGISQESNIAAALAVIVEIRKMLSAMLAKLAQQNRSES